MIPQNIIVNADDFGYSDSVNRAIVYCFANGLINRTTAMANMPAIEQAYALAFENGFLPQVGLHINLTEGMPLTENMRSNRKFTYPDGSFNHRIRTLVRSGLNSAEKTLILNEIKAQIQRFQQLGFTLGHVDSHHHSHTEYALYSLLCQALAETGVKSMRIARNLYTPTLLEIPKMLYKWGFNHKVKSKFFHTDFFGSYEDFSHADISADKSYEVMVHPSFLSDGRLVDIVGDDEYADMENNYSYDKASR